MNYRNKFDENQIVFNFENIHLSSINTIRNKLFSLIRKDHLTLICLTIE